MNGLNYLKDFLKNAPTASGVYRFVDEKDEIIYIGKARNLKNRLSNYALVDKLTNRMARAVYLINKIETTETRTEAEALLLEASLIRQHKPRYNILLKDDKSFPYIEIDEGHDFPRIKKHRGKKKKNATYYGPFPSSMAVKQAINSIQKVFQVRPCKDSFFKNRTRPCLEYDIKKCTAPCVNYVSKEEYSKQIDDVKKFLSGKNFEIQKQLTTKMEEAAEKMEYEIAASFRNRIRALAAIQAKQSIAVQSLSDADVIAIYQIPPRTCIEIFFVRAGQSVSHIEYFPKRTEDMTVEEILEMFIGHFYQNNPPPKEIILSHEIANKEILEEALYNLAQTKISISTPQRGDKRDIIERALNNAKSAIEKILQEDEVIKNTLQNLAEKFAIKTEIKRVEIFDNSHIFGTNSIGAMVVAGFDEEGKWGFLKKHYRKFNVAAAKTSNRPLTGGDDYFMMEQVLRRRYSRLKDEGGDYPDLILIDGGKGQLSSAEKVFAELGLLDTLKFVCIAKGEDRNAGREDFYLPNQSPFKFPEKDELLYFLQKLRDEAHRFAIEGHRKKREKSALKTALDEIPNIGTGRKRALLNHFGSARAVSEASIPELRKVEGISEQLAKKIHDWFA
jgi:excinuclease ABC subunit C